MRNLKLGSPKLLKVLSLLATLLALAPLATSAQETIKIGVVQPLTGGIGTYGQENYNAMKMALEKINKKGVKGKKIQLIVEDDRSDQIEATNAIRKLINVDKVSVIIGEVTSSNSLAMAPIAQEAKIPMVSSAATNEKVTQVGNYISRTCFTDDFQGVVMARFAFNNLKKKNAIVIIDNSSDYSKGLAKAFNAEWKRLGGNYASTEDFSYAQKDIDFQTLLRKVKRANPDVLFVPGYYEEVGLILKQAKKMGITAPFLGGDGWDSPKLFEIAGPEGSKGNYISSHFAPDDSDPAVQAFVRDYEKLYKVRPGAMAALGYDVIGVVADAITRAKSLKSEDINNAILATKGFKGITGAITIDEKRNSKKSAVVLATTENTFKFQQKVNP